MGSFGDELNELRRDNTGSSKCNIAMGYYCNEIFMFIKRVKIWRKKNKDFCAIHSFSLHARSLFPSDGALRAASGGSSPLPTAGPVTLNSLVHVTDWKHVETRCVRGCVCGCVRVHRLRGHV